MTLLHFKHRIIALCALLGVLYMVSCDADNLTKEKAESLLNSTYEDKLINICTLDGTLSEEPEFQPLIGERFCKTKYQVNDIFYISLSAVNVKYTITTLPQPAST